MLRNIFVVKNYTLKEVYFGSTNKRVRDGLSDMRHHRSRAARHWNWDEQDIEWRIVSRHIPLPVAALKVWQLKHRRRDGWRTV